MLGEKSTPTTDWIDDAISKQSIFEDAPKLPKDDQRRLGLLHPKAVQHLLETDDHTTIADKFHYAENMVSLKRCVGSRIPRDEAETKWLELRTLLKPHFIYTQVSERTEDEEPVFQWLYRDAAR